MRPRFAVLGSVLTALAVAASPAVSGAAPRHNHGLTINAAPNPIIAGEPVLVYGQLNAGPVAGQSILLYHHVNGTHQRFTLIGHTTTDAHGFYAFQRPDGLVTTNRQWFVREASGQHVHSRTVFEHVAALVSLSASSTNADTGTPIVFSGQVTPAVHAGERVYLQVQRGGGDNWRTINSARLDGASKYTIAYRWRVPGARDVRVVFRGDFRNIRAESDPVTVTIQQKQIADFTINSSDPVIPEGSMATISGVLYQPATATPEPSTSVTLWGRVAGQRHFTAIETTTTGADGSYSFNEKPVQNTVYQARTTFGPHRHSAALFEGVRDVLTFSANPVSVSSGQPVTFSGSVTPDKAGDVVYLQRLGTDGDWHTVGVSVVRHDSTFRFVRAFGAAGTKTFRARIPGDPQNIGGASSPVTVTVAVPPVASLPPAS
jgi:hypothetical protein